MAPPTLRFMSLLCWFCGVFPLCYYVALAVVCGIHRRWIAAGLAIATACLMLLWLLFNGFAVFAAVWLHHAHNTAATPQDLSGSQTDEREGEALLYPGAAPTRAHALGGVTAVDPISDSSNARLRGGEREGDLLSIQEVPLAAGNCDGAGEELTMDSVASEGTHHHVNNPLTAPRSHHSHHGRRGLTVWVQTSVGTSHAEAEEGTESGAAVTTPTDGSGPGTLPVPHSSTTVPPSGSACPPTLRPARDSSVDSARHSAPDYAAIRSEVHVVQSAPKETDTSLSFTGSPTSVSPFTEVGRRHAFEVKEVTATLDGSPRLMPVAFMMPLASLYITLAMILLFLVSGFLYEYDTHCLMLSLPVLSVPLLCAALLPLSGLFDDAHFMARDFHRQLLHVLTHWLCILLVSTAAFGIYLAAFIVESVHWTPYFLHDVPTPRAIRVVSYLSPIPIFIVAGTFVVNTALVTHATLRLRRQKRRSVPRLSRPARASSTEKLTPTTVVPATRGAKPSSHIGRLSSFMGTSPVAFAHPNSFSQAQQGLVTMAHHYPVAVEPDEMTSTLSSIVRSSLTSSVFVPSSSLISLPSASVGRGTQRGARSVSNGSSAVHNTPITLCISSMPQLKSVTMLYVAYRNIYDDGDDATRGPYNSLQQGGGMAANRNFQQTISANFEAMTEALEEAREQAVPDENAYVLTAYEDALCLVWGLMPFSSEPVLVALEKARQIMKAFKSRPKPPPASPDEQQELVAAVVSAPHSLVGFIGTDFYRGVHFFNPRQHDSGTQLMQRGLTMYRRLPSVQSVAADAENAFDCILMNDKAWSATASHVLARPCGLLAIPTIGGNTQLPSSTAHRAPVNASTAVTKPGSRQYPVMYNFMEFVHAKEEEWHLVVQRQERLGEKFGFLSEATQCLQQGNPQSARQVLTTAVKATAIGANADNVVLAQMLLEDLDRCNTSTTSNNHNNKMT